MTSDHDHERDTRELSPMDVYCYENAVVITTIIAANSSVFYARNAEEKMRDAFDRVVSASPILTTRIVESSSSYDSSSANNNGRRRRLRHEFVYDPKIRPELRIVDVDDDDDDDVETRARDICDRDSDELVRADRESLRYSSSFRSCVVRRRRRRRKGRRRRGSGDDDGENEDNDRHRVAFCCVAPHHLVDGRSLVTSIVKAYAYVLLPRLCWPVADAVFGGGRRRRGRCLPPTFRDAAFRGAEDVRDLDENDDDDERRRSVVVSSDPRNFSFDDATRSSSRLVAIMDRRVVGRDVDASVLAECRNRLRARGATVSSAFGALAVRTLARLLDARGANPDRRPILSTLAADARGLSRVANDADDEERRRTRGTAASFFSGVGPKEDNLARQRGWSKRKGNDGRGWRWPTVDADVANYFYVLPTQVPYDAAVRDDIVDVARVITNDGVNRMRNDLRHRLDVLSVSEDGERRGGGSFPPNNLFVGVSSVIQPVAVEIGYERMTMRSSVVTPDTLPKIWFFVVTYGNTTHVVVDVVLPEFLFAADAALTAMKEEVSSVMAEIVRDSPLEPLLNYCAAETGTTTNGGERVCC